MPVALQQSSQVPHQSAEKNQLAIDLAVEVQSAVCLTVGLLSGSRNDNDRRTIDCLVHEIAEQFAEQHTDGRMLLIRLETAGHRDALGGSFERIPLAHRSPLGPWSEVVLPVSNKPLSADNWYIDQLPEWLPVWKDAFRLILVDLGSIGGTPSRVVGRLCDSCYVLLGPKWCASHEWIMQQIAWHSQSGSSVCGTLLVQ